MFFEVIHDIQIAADKELVSASEKYGSLFASPAEGYAVIKEELEEAEADTESFNESFKGYWNAVKTNDGAFRILELKQMEIHAAHAAAEWIQVVAMCRKALKSEEGGTK